MKVGLALAGGGVKGASHIGVIKALQENGIEVEEAIDAWSQEQMKNYIE